MGKLSAGQSERVEKYLREQGITYSPLREELLDHLLTDLEKRIDSGSDFQAAWQEVTGEIAGNHLKEIETETMALLNNKINLTNVLAGTSILILALATLFKLFHLAGAGYLMLTFLIVTAASLFTSAIVSISRHPEKKGRTFLMFSTIALVLFLVYLAFKILHLPGANQIGMISIILISILFPLLSWYFYSSEGKLKDHVVVNLLNRNGRSLEIIALVMVSFGLLLNLSSWLLGEPQMIGIIFFILTVIWIGLYAYSFTWKIYLEHNKGSLKWLLIFSSIALILLLLPVYYFLPDWLRTLSIVVAPGIYIGIMWTYYTKPLSGSGRRMMQLVCGVFLLYPILILAARLHIDAALQLATSLPFELGWLGFLFVTLYLFRHDKYFRVLAIFMIAMHMIPALPAGA